MSIQLCLYGWLQCWGMITTNKRHMVRGVTYLDHDICYYNQVLTKNTWYKYIKWADIFSQSHFQITLVFPLHRLLFSVIHAVTGFCPTLFVFLHQYLCLFHSPSIIPPNHFSFLLYLSDS